MTTQQQIADLAASMKAQMGMVDFLVGSHEESRILEIADEWVNADVDAEAWWEAGCFDADSASTLDSLGVTPEQASKGPEDESESWAYLYSNGDVSADEICEHFGIES